MTKKRDNSSEDQAHSEGRGLTDDRGVTLILVALMLVPLLVFTAFAVDLGGLYAERRQDQTAADVAALAAAQDLPRGESAMVTTAKRYAEDTLGTTISNGADGWNSCPRPDPAGLSTQAAGASCISYTGSQVRVRLPDRFYPSTFGAIVGIDDYRHSAFAIAGMEGAGFGNVLPFFTTTAKAESGYNCLVADGPNECRNQTGSFFPLIFSYHTPTCFVAGNNATRDQMLTSNAGTGIDHLLSRYGQDPHRATVVVDPTAGCPLLPNATNNFTGNRPLEVRNGLLNGSASQFRDDGSSRLPRLQRNAGAGLPRRTVYGGLNVDDTPLWWFIPANYGPGEATPADIPTSCKRDQFVNSSGQYYSNLRSNPDLDLDIAAHLMQFTAESQRVLGLMDRCFDHYEGRVWDGYPGTIATPDAASGCTGACDAPVFALNSRTEEPDLFDIQYSPRFGYSPETLAIPVGGSGEILFNRFRAIYINRMIMGNASSTWDAGFAPSGSSIPNSPQTSVQSFFFPQGMLPGGLGAPDAANVIGVNRFIRLVR